MSDTIKVEVEDSPSNPAGSLADAPANAPAGFLRPKTKPEIQVTEDEERMRLYPWTYVCGPMTGYPEFNHPEFNRVTKLLRAKGLKVINPAEVDAGDFGQPWDFYLRRDIQLIAKKVGRVVLLSGWQNSHGATLERYVAEKLRCEIINVSEFDEWYEAL